jgi:hypothetical protein
MMCVLLLGLAACGHSPTAPDDEHGHHHTHGPAPSGPTTIGGAEFFHLVPGTRWVLVDEKDSARVTMITVEVIDGALCLRFVSTDHSNDRILYIGEGAGFFFMGNSNGSDAVGDAFPDDIRLSLGLRLWFQGHDGHPCPLLPSGAFTVPAEHTSPHQYFMENAEGSRWSAPGVWRVRWDLVDSDTVCIRVDENFGADFYYFDWYLCRACGFTQIAWWNDAARTSRIRRIVEAGG